MRYGASKAVDLLTKSLGPTPVGRLRLTTEAPRALLANKPHSPLLLPITTATMNFQTLLGVPLEEHRTKVVHFAKPRQIHQRDRRN